MGSGKDASEGVQDGASDPHPPAAGSSCWADSQRCSRQSFTFACCGIQTLLDQQGVCHIHHNAVCLLSQHVAFHVVTLSLSQVDRSVTGLVAQQQCVGPLHTPLADVAVVALSPFGLEGAATAIGEQPIKGLVSPAAGARMAVGEALTNLVFARVTAMKVRD